MAEHAITVQEVTKHYGSLHALGGISLDVPRGLLFGLLGPNGAGKSTLIKALVGALRPTAGAIRVLGLDPMRNRSALREQIGYMPQSTALYQDLSARDNVAFFGKAHHTLDLTRRVDEVLTLTELSGRTDEPVRQFSGGMQRRVSLASAIVHQPPMIFLDEPTAAVDPALRARFWQKFRDFASQGTTLFISTHLMDEAMLCDRVAVIRRGKLIACAPPRELLAQGTTRLTVVRSGREVRSTIGSKPEDLAGALYPCGLAPDVEAIDVDPDSLEAVLLRLFDRQDDGGPDQ